MAAAAEVMQQLETCGTEQNRKVYQRHGVGENMYGVSYANLNAIRKSIKTDHALAVALWATGNHDARILATMVADPAQADQALLERWAADLTNYVLSDALAGFVARTPIAQQVGEAWIERDAEWIEHTGWVALASVASSDPSLPAAYFEAILARIERDIHGAKNRVRHAMNTMLIGIGGRGGALSEKAIAAANRIGKVVVDHGQTGCKTPAAVPYIEKMLARQNKG